MKFSLVVFASLLILSSCGKHRGDCDNKHSRRGQAQIHLLQVVSAQGTNSSYSYNDNGVNSCELNMDSGKVTVHYDVKYDEQGRVITKSNSRGWREEMEYDAKGMVASIKVYGQDKGDPQPVMKGIYKYLPDATGRIEKVVLYSGSGNTDATVMLQYDTRGNVKHSVEKDERTGELTITDYEYDTENGIYTAPGFTLNRFPLGFSNWGPNNCIKSVQYDGDNTETLRVSYTYEYNRDGFPVKSISTIGHNKQETAYIYGTEK